MEEGVESEMGSTLPLSASAGTPPGDVIALDSTMAKGLMETLQQINVSLTVLNTTLRAQKTSARDGQDEKFRRIQTRTSLKTTAIDPELVTLFTESINQIDCDVLLNMLNEHPGLWPYSFDEDLPDLMLQNTVLHAAVRGDSVELLARVLTLLESEEFSTTKEFVNRLGHHGLTAWSMAVIIGNPEIRRAFAAAFIDAKYFADAYPDSKCLTNLSELKSQGVGVTEEWLQKLRQAWTPSLFDFIRIQLPGEPEFLEKPDGTRVDPSLFRPEFFLHEALQLPNDKFTAFVKNICSNWAEPVTLAPLLNLRNKEGQTPLHVVFATNSSDFDTTKIEVLEEHFPSTFDMNVEDYLKRTPLHWAAAYGNSAAVAFLARDARTNLVATIDTDVEYLEDSTDTPIIIPVVADEHAAFTATCFNMTALHVAAIHNHSEVVRELLQAPRLQVTDVNFLCIRIIENFPISPTAVFWTPFQLAALMGHAQTLEVFLEDDRVYDEGFISKTQKKTKELENYNKISALHLAAVSCQPTALKVLLDSKRFKVLNRDPEGNTALHYIAARAGETFRIFHALDFTSLENYIGTPEVPDTPSGVNIIACMELLMQAGLRIDQANNMHKTPTLGDSAPESVQQWWFNKFAVEMQEKKSNLAIAAQAISVTAALVATTSFVGPLQPPLGLSSDSGQPWLLGFSQVQYSAVRVFLVCISLSFYFAIASIILAILPSWPIQHESLEHEVRVAERGVQAGIISLFSSITFVICAYGAASIAIVPENGSWRYKSLTIIPTIVGTLICFGLLVLSSLRLLRVISPKSRAARRFSRLVDIILCI